MDEHNQLGNQDEKIDEPVLEKRSFSELDSDFHGIPVEPSAPNERTSLSRSREQRARRRKQKARKRLMIWGTLLIVFTLTLTVGLFMAAKSFVTSPSGEAVLTGTTVTVEIPQGASTSAIADILKENGLIKSTLMFRLQSRLDGYDGTYRQGSYDIDTGLKPTEIMQLLQTGVVVENQLKITIPEGYNTLQIAARVEEAGIATAEEFIEVANTATFDFDFLEGLPEREYRLEGYLFPDTYFLLESTTAYDLIEMMLKRFSQIYTDEYKQVVANSAYTLDELVTMASIIEKEIAVADERQTAAGVIYNRLAIGMPLQMDATVLYAMGIVKEDVTYADLEVDSPYNTYKVPALPIGPIASPGAASFYAALYPEDNKYYYYVVEARGQSNHVYCETYEQFLAAKAKYQAS